MLIFLCFPYGLYCSCERDRIWVFGFHLGYACCCNVWLPLGHDSNSSAGRSCVGFLATFYLGDIWILIIFSIIQSFDFCFLITVFLILVVVLESYFAFYSFDSTPKSIWRKKLMVSAVYCLFWNLNFSKVWYY